MLGLLEHLARQNREEVFIKTLQWILNLPTFIVNYENKQKLVARLFKLSTSEVDLSANLFDEDLGHLKVKTERRSLYLLSIHRYSQSPDFYKKEIDNGGIIAILYPVDSPDNLSTESTIVISYAKLVEELTKLSIRDSKTQYLIGDFISGLEKFAQNEKNRQINFI